VRAPGLVAIGLAAYSLFLVATMPASFVLARAQGALPGKFEVREASGSAWHGSAKVTLATPGGPVAVDRLEWHLKPSRPAAGRIAFDIAAEASGLKARAEGARTLGHWEANGLDARGDAPTMATLLPWLAPFRPEGVVAIASPRLATDGTELEGDARIEWRWAAVSLSDVRPLGTYRADVHAEGHAGRVRVTTLEGPLRITGEGTLTPPTRFAFTGEARAEGPQAAALEALLARLGPARADGSRALEWRVN
jgi:general secretion pathway protein N